MRHATRLISALAVAALCGCTESLYRTEPTPLSNKGGFVPVAPYFVKIANKINVAIVPAPPPKDATTLPGPPTLTVTLTPVPVARAYLYFKKNSFFNNTFNVGVGNDGLLTSSDSSSVQQVTAVLTELAQAAAAFVAPTLPGVPAAPRVTPALPSDDPAYCAAGIAQLTASVALYKSFDPAEIGDTSATYQIASTLVLGKDSTKTVRLALKLEVPPGLSSGLADVSAAHAGFVAYAPVPTIASIVCTAEKGAALPLSQPMVIYPYFVSRYIDPKRDFLTDPAETFTLNAGFLTGHKYTDQSGAKTIIDTITAPIRAVLPSVSVQQSTQVQTGGGKPDQTTTTTQTTTGPPKTQ